MGMDVTPLKNQQLEAKSQPIEKENWLVVSTHLKNISQNGIISPNRALFFLHFRHHRPEARNGRMQSIRLNRVKVRTKTLYSLIKVAYQATKLLNHVLRTVIESVQTAPVPNMCQNHMGQSITKPRRVLLKSCGFKVTGTVLPDSSTSRGGLTSLQTTKDGFQSRGWRYNQQVCRFSTHSAKKPLKYTNSGDPWPRQKISQNTCSPD